MVGIVASRIVERFHRPAVLVGINDDGQAQGSGRSIGGFHLARALAHCGHLLDTHGGHEMAVGLKFRADRLGEFRDLFCAYAAEHVTVEQLRPEVKLEVSATLPQVTRPLVNDLARMGPFGQGNRRPVVCCRDVKLAGPPRRVGKGGTVLHLRLAQGGTIMKCVVFNAGPEYDELHDGQRLDVAVDPQLNEFNGSVSVELKAVDVRPAGAR